MLLANQNQGLTFEQMHNLNCNLLLNNTYHLGLHPGQSVLDQVNGAHAFQNWNRNILTDSGGFQMVSLLKLAHITEEGVRFLSPRDGSPMLLTPEHSIALQESIGSDIMMQLDDVVSSLTTGPRVKEAMERSIRWLDRCINAYSGKKPQNLFCIIQGGLDMELRKQCCAEMVKRDTPGIAIGGLSGGEEKEMFSKVVNQCTSLLPEEKPRYLMGVGYAEDLVVCVALGIDMFDCVFPTRTARFGNALLVSGSINLKDRKYKNDDRPIDDNCECECCKSVSRAYLHHLIHKETAAAHLITLHNIHFQLDLMRNIRNAIIEQRFPTFVIDFFQKRYPHDKPNWAVDALDSVGIDL